MTHARHQDITIGDLRRFRVPLPQAALVLNVDVRLLRKAIERHIVSATLVKQGERHIRTLDGVGVLGLRIGTFLEKERSKGFRLQLDQAADRDGLEDVINAYARKEKGLAGFIHDTAVDTVAGLRSLTDLGRHIGDTGMINGTAVEAQRIAALVAGGMSVDEIIDDYPNLDAEQVAAAVKYAEAHPKPGRPFPARTAKSVLRRGGGGGLAAAFAAGDESGM